MASEYNNRTTLIDFGLSEGPIFRKFDSELSFQLFETSVKVTFSYSSWLKKDVAAYEYLYTPKCDFPKFKLQKVLQKQTLIIFIKINVFLK